MHVALDAHPWTGCIRFESRCSHCCITHRVPTAAVTPKFKGGDNADLSCHRSISVLLCISKILEKRINAQRIYYVEIQTILNPLQSGFKSGHSYTTTTLKSCVCHCLCLASHGLWFCRPLWTSMVFLVTTVVAIDGTKSGLLWTSSKEEFDSSELQGEGTTGGALYQQHLSNSTWSLTTEHSRIS